MIFDHGSAFACPRITRLALRASVIALLPVMAAARVKVSSGYDAEGADFRLGSMDPPAVNDAAAKATFAVIDGVVDEGSGGVAALNDGKLPSDADQPGRNFFFKNGTDGGRLLLDLGKQTRMKAVNTYSWHSRNRAAQVYKLYGANGTEKDFNAEPKQDVDPAKSGWTLITKVSVSKGRRGAGGQYAVSVEDPGNYRYLLFDIERSGREHDSHTFYSEIDVIATGGPQLKFIEPVQKIIKHYDSPDKKYHFVVDATDAPDLVEWVDQKMMPMVYEWYPKLIALLPSSRYEAPDTVSFKFQEETGGAPAYAVGNRLTLNSGFYRSQLQGEALGCTVHEMTHTVQNYWRAQHTNPNPLPTPGWLTEGIADYTRWFLFEPEAKGAEITAGNVDGAKYDASYRVSANFLDWANRTYDPELVQKLNAAAREGKYSPKIWQDATGKSVEELGEEWIKQHRERLGK